MTTMRAVRFDHNTLELALREIEVPKAGPGKVRVRVGAAGVCLSDVHLASGALRSPSGTRGVVTLGHEVAGIVDDIGEAVVGWTRGDRVVIHPIVETPAGAPVHGMDIDGGWADFIVADASALVRIPDGLPFPEAAILPDAVSTPWAAVTSTARVVAGQSSAVWGIGGLGYHAVKLLRLVGSSPIIAVDPLSSARDRALEAGADVALDPASNDVLEQLLNASGGSGVDHAFDMVGAPTVREQALQALANAGQLTIVGAGGQPFTVDNVQHLIVSHHRIAGHFASQIAHLRTLVDLTAHGRLDLSASVTEVLPLEHAPDAIKQLRRKTDSQIRIVLDPAIWP